MNYHVPPPRPTRAEVEAAAGRTLPDVIGPDLKAVFCGINPGLYTAAIGHHFGRPGNRFWPALFTAGITPRLLSPYEEQELLTYGYGITNIVPRATATADELSREELIAGGQALVERIRQYAPRYLAFLGVTAYRAAFGRPKAKIGPQNEMIGSTRLWVLPNPSGLNAHYALGDIARLLAELKQAAEEEVG